MDKAGRPLKQTVEYFPHYAKASGGKTLFLLEGKYGAEGYAFFFKLLELLAETPGHYYDFTKPTNWTYMLARTKTPDTNKAADMLQILVDDNALDANLFASKIIWSDRFVQQLKETAYLRRKEEAQPVKPSPTPLSLNGTKLNGTKGNTEEIPHNVDNNAEGITNNATEIGNNTAEILKSPQNTSEKKTGNKGPAPSPLAMKLASQLKDIILVNLPKAKVPNGNGELTVWAKDFDRMMNLDKRSEADIVSMIQFSQHDSFWQSNILSPKKLREKFDTLYAKSQKPQLGFKKNFAAPIQGIEGLKDYGDEDE